MACALRGPDYVIPMDNDSLGEVDKDQAGEVWILLAVEIGFPNGFY
jgi:hypothetical protein